VKLYSYSSKLLTFVEAKWIKAKFAAAGILIGIIIPFGIIKLDQSVSFALGSRSASTLASENNFLRHQVHVITYRVSKFEMQAAQLNERADKLHFLLHDSRILGDTASRFKRADKEIKHQSLIRATKSFHP
jgi:hypothetical protein